LPGEFSNCIYAPESLTKPMTEKEKQEELAKVEIAPLVLLLRSQRLRAWLPVWRR